MPKFRLLPVTTLILALFSGESLAASELEQMRASLAEMQKLLQQQQARIEQLEKQSAERLPAPATTVAAAVPAAPTAPPPANGGAPKLALAPGLATFFGRIDMFAEADWGGSQGKRAAIESGGMNGSRLGVKGGTSLTADSRLIYVLEAGFFANNGRQGQSSGGNTRLFGRQAYLGIDGGYGKLTVGRQYSPYFMETIRFDAFENGYGSPTNDGNVKPGPTRYDNAVIYSAPTYHGFTGTTMLALGGKTGGTEQNAVALNLNYTQGPLGLGLSYLHDNHITLETQRANYAFAGGSYQIGRFRLMGGLAGADLSPDFATTSAWRSWFIGSRIDVTSSGQLWLNYGEGHTRLSAIDDRGTVYSAAWMENINQQVKAYLAYARHFNHPGSALVPSGTSAYAFYSVNAGDNANGLALGLQYAF